MDKSLLRGPEASRVVANSPSSIVYLQVKHFTRPYLFQPLQLKTGVMGETVSNGGNFT